VRNIKLTIEYDGTDYCGWQSQKNGIAIQDMIKKAIIKVTEERVSIAGSGRTDSGVHAKGQVANFKTNSRLPVNNIKKGLNRYLPKDVIITDIKEVKENFHSQYNVKSKIYRYAFTNRVPISPFNRNYVAKFSYGLDLALMEKEAGELVGTHDFSAFQSIRSKRKDPVRTIKSILIKKNSKFIYMDIEANGFLYNMVRNIAGTLMEIGRGKFEPGSTKHILKSRNRKNAGPTAPAKGLCLMRVRY